MRIVHVTPYPPQGEKHVKGSGVASYAKNLVSHLAGEQIVVAQKLNGALPDYTEDDIEVRRVYDRTPRFIWQVHSALKTLNPDVVHIQQELALFGNLITAYLLQWLVFAWRDRVVITLHGVIDLTLIDRQFIRGNNYNFPAWFVRFAFRVIYIPLVRYAKTVIVHEEKFKDILVQQYGANEEKIIVVPHGVEKFTTIDQGEAREHLKLPRDAHLVLFMGYATGYKGIDLLLEGFAEFARRDPKAFLVIGAGEHPRVKDSPEYQRKYQAWHLKAAKLIPAGQYRWEGFISETDITPFYSAADVAVFPYAAALASSGPMSMAIGHKRPFLASIAFTGIFNTHLLFQKTPEAMAAKLEAFFAERHTYEEFIEALHTNRLWGRVAESTNTIYSQINGGKADDIEERAATG